MSRFVHLFFLLAMLGALILLLTVYLYTESVYFKKEFVQKINESLPMLSSPLKSIHELLEKSGGSTQLGFGVLFLTFTLYILGMLFWYAWKNREKRQGKLNKRFLLLVLFLFCLAGGVLAGMYYWPEDQIDCYFFIIHRGSSAQFLAQILDIGILVTGFHLVLFLLLMISHFVLPGKKKKEKN